MIAEIQKAIVSFNFIENYPELRNNELEVMQSNKPEAMILATKSAVNQRTDIEGLSNINCPTLIVCGAEDHATPKDIAEQMQKSIQNASLKVIPNAGHHVPVEAADEFYNAIIQFLNKKLGISKANKN